MNNLPQIIKESEELIRNSKILSEIMEIQDNLKKEGFNFDDHKRRIEAIRFFQEKGHLLTNYFIRLNLHEDSSYTDLYNRLVEVKDKAYFLIREKNPVILARSPLDVIPSDDLPQIFIINDWGQKEVRKEYGLHKKINRQEGMFVGMAFTPPNYKQSFHLHSKVKENTLILGGKIIAKYKDWGKENVAEVNRGEIASFEKNTLHTLDNQSNEHSLNITAKLPIDNGSLSQVRYSTKGNCRILNGQDSSDESFSWGKIKRFSIKDNGYQYLIELMHINPGAAVFHKHDGDEFSYIIAGQVYVENGSISKVANQNDLIVIDTGTKHKIKNLSDRTAILYRVIP